jgi:ankyrin repeat protein
MLKILVSHGASVHDIVGESTMTTMTLACDRHAPDAYISYLRLLKEEQYTEFDITDGVGKSALYNAIRDGEMAGAAIDLLAESGVRITRILPDGRTALHFAAEMARTAEILQSLMNRFPPDEINRLDQWGWSPLHYAVESYHDSAKKIAMLLKGGADPYCKSDELYQNGFHTSLMYERPLTPFQFASELLPYFPGKFESFAQHIESTRLLYIEDEEDSSMEYCDAVEALS